jgi:hypothetical protein
MNIATCSLAMLLFSGMACARDAGQFEDHRAGADDGLSQRHLASHERRDWGWARDKSAPVTVAPEISAESAISALVLLGGTLILLYGRHGSKPKI